MLSNNWRLSNMTCFHGKILNIDLSTGSQETITILEDHYRQYLGGSGLAAAYFAAEGLEQILPLSEQSVLSVFSGLLTGISGVPTACKASFCGISPATGIWAEAVVGGYWPAALRSSGLDGLHIRGRSPHPVYLYINEEKAEIIDASSLWGKCTYSTTKRLQEKHGADVRVAAIGPAGENEVLIAAIIIDGHDARAAGRCGLGALMGAKHLKAIVVEKGSKLPHLYDKKGLMALTKKALPIIREKSKGLSEFGTAGGVPVVEKLGDLPIANWTLGSWTQGAEKVSGQAMATEYFTGHYACFSCPIRCGKDMKVTVGPHKGSISHGPEYETIAGFGAMCLNDNPEYVIAANDLCNRLGLDTISGSAVIAFAMELAENGLIPEEYLTESPIKWGDGEVILTLIEKIAYKKGLGELLSQGVRKAARQIGNLAYEYSVECKGLEVAYHDPRAFTSMALIYATGNRGACHLEGLTYFCENMAFPASLLGLPAEYDPHGIEGKPRLAKMMQDYLGTYNALGLCKFLIRGQISPAMLAGWVAKATGWDIDEEELLITGERLFNLKRILNNKLNISRKDDTLPPRLLVHDRQTGGAAGSLPHLGKMLSEYYQLRGWSVEGIPLKSTLNRLGLKQ